MENQGSAGVITLESLMNAAPLPIEDSLGSKEALENEMNSGEEVLPGLSDLKPLSETKGSDENPPKKEEDEEESEEKEDLFGNKLTNSSSSDSDDIIDPIGEGNSDTSSSSTVDEAESSKLYKDTLKSLWGEDISSISVEENGEEVEYNIEDVELDAETFADIIRSKFEAEKENATKNKISIDQVSDFTKSLIEIDQNGGDVRSLLEVKQAYSDPLDNLDLNDPNDQAQIVYLRGLASNQNEADIKRLIKSYSEEGILEDMAQQAESELRAAVDAKIQDELKKSEEDKKEREELFKAYRKDVKEYVTKSFELKDNYKNKLVDMATKITPEGSYELDLKYQEWRLNPEKASELALLMYDREEFIKQITRKAIHNEKLETAKKLKIIPRSSKIAESQKSPASSRAVHISDLNK
jgi:hypothetical protein